MNIAGKDLKFIETARGKKDAFTGMALGISGELSFRQLENRVPGIDQTQSGLDFFEDSNSVVENRHFRTCRRFFDTHGDRLSAGMVDGVVEHLGKGVLPDLMNVFWQSAELEGDVAPGSIFGKCWRATVSL